GVARLRLRPVLDAALRDAERVDAQAVEPGRAAEVVVERGLDAGLPDLVPGDDAERLLFQLLLGDLGHVAEELRREAAVRVVAQERVLQRQAAELVLVLLQVRDLTLADGL